MHDCHEGRGQRDGADLTSDLPPTRAAVAGQEPPAALTEVIVPRLSRPLLLYRPSSQHNAMKCTDNNAALATAAAVHNATCIPFYVVHMMML